MQRFANLGHCRHRLDHPVGHVIRVRADETDTVDSVEIRNRAKQIGKTMLENTEILRNGLIGIAREEQWNYGSGGSLLEKSIDFLGDPA